MFNSLSVAYLTLCKDTNLRNTYEFNFQFIMFFAIHSGGQWLRKRLFGF